VVKRVIRLGVYLPPWRTPAIMVVHLHPKMSLTSARDFVVQLQNHVPQMQYHMKHGSTVLWSLLYIYRHHDVMTSFFAIVVHLPPIQRYVHSESSDKITMYYIFLMGACRPFADKCTILQKRMWRIARAYMETTRIIYNCTAGKIIITN